MNGKKIGIATITFTKDEKVDYNYGNILQNYALSQYLKDRGYEVNTIYYTSTYLGNIVFKTNTKRIRCFRQLMDDAIRVTRRKIQYKELRKKRNDRCQKFKSFINSYIIYSEKDYDVNSDLKHLDALYDCFITGSDQVWNPYYEGSNEFYYLNFASKGKRVSYAPSIAVDKIPYELQSSYKKWISQIDYLSIREEAGKKLLENEFEINSEIACDPVFLLDVNQWRKVSCKSKIKEKFFLVYILGKKNTEIKKYIKKIEKAYGIKSVEIYNKDEINSSFSGPREFVGLFDDAEFIFTNSFHGTAFSIIFRKDLILVERDGGENMSSRIDSILKMAGVSNRNVDFILENPKLLETHYKSEKLEQLIKSSKAFLDKAINQQ